MKHTVDVTREEIRYLFTPGAKPLDRGPRYTLITRADVEAVASSGDLYIPDDPSMIAASTLDILADQFNSEDPAELPEDRHAAAVDAVLQARLHMEQVVEAAEAEFNEAIRSAIATGARVADIAVAADRTRSRIYQIRDGRR